MADAAAAVKQVLAAESSVFLLRRCAMANLYPTFSNRDPLAAAFWAIGGTVGLITFARATTPWILWPVFFAWLYVTIARNVTRGRRLNKEGYFSGRRLRKCWIYEEMQGYNVATLILPVDNTEPGHWEMFIPADSVWRTTVPSWAWERRLEIAARIAEAWKPKDFHLPNDMPQSTVK